MQDSCPLCTIPSRRHEENIHYEDEEILIVDTKNKKTHKERLMLVVKPHVKQIPREKEQKYIEKFIEIAKPKFSWAPEFYVFGWNPKRKTPIIPDHWHKIAEDKKEDAPDYEELFCQPREDMIKISSIDTKISAQSSI